MSSLTEFKPEITIQRHLTPGEIKILTDNSNGSRKAIHIDDHEIIIYGGKVYRQEN